MIYNKNIGTRKQKAKPEGTDMKNVYIGKESINGNGLAICRVIDSDIATGDATVYNRETDKIETVKFSEKRTLWKNIRKLSEDTESEYEEKVTKALVNA